MATKLIWLSDLHFVVDGYVLGHDPRARLNAAIDLINSHHGDADFCVISGDMVNRGTEGDYEALATQLDRLRVPVLPMVGNHDDRELFDTHLPTPEGLNGFAQYVVETADGLVACLDTLDPGADSGAFCAARSAWLRDLLGQGRPTCIFMHHPPMSLGLPMQDQDQLVSGDDLLDLVTSYPNVTYLMFGHVHRPIVGNVRGIPFATMRAVSYQAPPPVPAWDWSTFVPAAEAPALGVVMLKEGEVTLQYYDICAYSVGTTTS